MSDRARFDDPHALMFYLLGVAREARAQHAATGEMLVGDLLAPAVNAEMVGFDLADMQLWWPTLLIEALTRAYVEYGLSGNPWQLLAEMAAEHAANPAAPDEWPIMIPPGAQRSGVEDDEHGAEH